VEHIGPPYPTTPAQLQHFQEELRDRGYQYVEFRLGEIENLPVADNTADVVISNLRDQSLAE